MHQSFFLNHLVSVPKENQGSENAEDLEKAIVELNTRNDERKVEVVDTCKPKSQLEESNEVKSTNGIVSDVDHSFVVHEVSIPSSSIQIVDTDPIDDLLNSNKDINSLSFKESQEWLEKIREVKNQHLKQLEQIENMYLQVKERNSITVTLDTKKPIGKDRTVVFNNNIGYKEEKGEQVESPTKPHKKLAWSEEINKRYANDKSTKDYNKTTDNHTDKEECKSKESDTTSEEEEEIEENDYKHFYNSSFVNNEMLDDEEKEKVYNWNDISDTMTSMSEYSDIFAEEKRDIKKKDITVPIPFKFFDRELRKEKTIHQKKLEEYINKIKAEEEYHLNKRFKANPVPKSVKDVGRYELLRLKTSVKYDKQTLREKLEKNLKPFYFASRDEKRLKEIEEEMERKREQYYIDHEFNKPFRANPIPTNCLRNLYHKLLEEKEEQRKERKAKRVEKLTKTSKLPRRMEMWKKLHQQQQLQQQQQLESSSNSIGNNNKQTTQWGINELKQEREREITFKPIINRSVPDFKKLQQQFQDTLKVLKTKKRPTTPQPFKFHSSSFNEMKTRSVLKEAGIELAVEDDFEIEKKKKKEQLITAEEGAKKKGGKRPWSAPKPKFYAPDTIANKKRAESVKKLMEEKERKRKEKELEEQRFAEKLNRTSKKVIPNIDPVPSVDQKLKESLNVFRRESLQAMKEKRKENEMVERKLESRPFLFEEKLKQQVKEDVMDRIHDTLKENGTEYLMNSIKKSIV
ncbi:hypothetical protein ABK040_001433 [Willaertia magna]